MSFVHRSVFLRRRFSCRFISPLSSDQRTMSSSSPSSFQWHEHDASLRRESVAAFNAFLARAKAQLFQSLTAVNPPPVHVMIGNEAADADSIVSSMVYAFHRDHVTQTRHETTIHIPVLPIPRSELPLRCDVSSLFAALEIDATSLVFVDEFPWRHHALPKSRLRITLLDHNALNPKRIAKDVTADELGNIVEILDHHQDIGCHPHASTREIAFENGQALVASCCTLVAEKLLATEAHDAHVQALGSTMLLAVIALDSVNFDPSAKKVTSRDVAAANKLEKASFATSDALFQWLQAEKFNVAHWHQFSIINCLQCDYKEFSTPSQDALYGVSAVLISLRQFVSKALSAEALMTELQSYVDANKLAFLVVMSMTHGEDGTRRREILMYEPGNQQTYTKQCVAHFQADGTLEIEPLTDLPLVTGDARIAAFHQRNTGASRKQVVPLIQQALTSPGKL